MKTGRPSTTATWVSFMRGLASLDAQTVARDSVARALVPPGYARLLDLAARSPRAERLVRGAWELVAKGRTQHIARRTRAIDDAIDMAIARGTQQLVVVGAGLDGRAWRMKSLADVTVFELDHPATQAYKRAKTAGLTPLAKAVRFLEVDFEHDSLTRAFLRGGHNPLVPSIFVLEGLTMYLTAGAIELALRAIAAESAPGSTLVMTYAERREPTLRRAMVLPIVRSVGEPIRSLLTKEQAHELCMRAGFTVIADDGDAELRARFPSARHDQADVSAERILTGFARLPSRAPKG